jgi:hypothetical protein
LSVSARPVLVPSLQAEVTLLDSLPYVTGDRTAAVDKTGADRSAMGHESALIFGAPLLSLGDDAASVAASL